MALIVEDGSGKTDAESYADEAFATAYATSQGGSATWDAANTATREAALRKATQWIDDEFGLRWKGYRKTQAQALRWPRQGVYDRDGYLVDSASLPLRLKQATATVALEVAAGKTLFASSSKTEVVGAKSIQVGSLAVSKTYLGGTDIQPNIPKAEALLQDLLRVTGAPERG